MDNQVSLLEVNGTKSMLVLVLIVLPLVRLVTSS